MRTRTSLPALLMLSAVALVLAACGDDDEGSDEATDAAFVAEMIPHHESAIEMAEIAQDRAEHPEIEQLADDIIATQSEEIDQLTAISERLGEAGGSLGFSEHEMGMSMDTSMLESAKPFDREFIDMMVPHHQSAILMAREELANGTDEESMTLAEEIIAAQSSEIDQMNEWRTDWYGAPSPAGGVPDEGDTSSEHEGRSH